MSDVLIWLGYGIVACSALAIGAVVLYRVRRKQTTQAQVESSNMHPPRRQPGVPAPFVYNAATPWGWLVYRNGNFLGQELALKRALISIGREEDNEVELDDDTISRYHAELFWEQGQVYVTDNESLNGVLLNGRRIRSSMLVKNGDLLEIGVHQFLMKYAQAPTPQDDMDDPLLKHLRRPTANPHTLSEYAPQHDNRPPAGPTRALQHSPIPQEAPFAGNDFDIAEQATSQIPWPPPPHSPVEPSPLNLPRTLRLPSRPIE